MEKPRHPVAQREISRYAMLAGPARGLDLFKRVPELLKRRGWPIDPDLVFVLCAAIGLKKIGAGRTVFRRPEAAEGCGGKWPAEAGKLEARQIVVELELVELLQAK